MRIRLSHVLHAALVLLALWIAHAEMGEAGHFADEPAWIVSQSQGG
ncbi:hypothetical protein [Tardiphaga sp.]|jgi:hypothetical protein